MSLDIILRHPLQTLTYRMALDYEFLSEKQSSKEDHAVVQERCRQLIANLDFYKLPAVFTLNVSHNYRALAEEVGLYDCMWHPIQNGMYTANDIIEPLAKGATALAAYDTEDAMTLRRYAWELWDACRAHPDAPLITCT